ncbi:hypothetical protein KBB68_03820 [Candidatus Babeliales bacterium]|nr:hypothetical protein [Candidatus Babeliales bacterium]
MNFSSKKYFFIFFSLTSFGIYAEDAQDSSYNVTKNEFDQEVRPKIKDFSVNDQKDLCRNVSNVFYAVIDNCKKAKNRCEEMIHTVDADPGQNLENGLNLGVLCGLAHVGILKGMKKFPKMQTVTTFMLPTMIVSYFVASRNHSIRDLEWDCKELKNQLSQTSNRSEKSK